MGVTLLKFVTKELGVRLAILRFSIGKVIRIANRRPDPLLFFNPRSLFKYNRRPTQHSLSFFFGINSNAQQSFSPEQFASDFDYLWLSLRDKYVYFDNKETDWSRVRELYRPKLAAVRTRSDFVSLLEQIFDELYDNHTSLNTNLQPSPRLVPTGLDVWAEWRRASRHHTIAPRI